MIQRQKQETLGDLRHHLYSKAGRLWSVCVLLALAVPFISIFSLWSRNDLALSFAGVLALVLPVASVWIREHADAVLIQADKCRRMILFADSFGAEIPASQLAEMTAAGLGVTIGPAPALKPYYRSRLRVGPQRLADNVAESAFYTKELAARFKSLLLAISATAALLAVVALSLSDLLISMSSITIVAAAKTVAVLAVFFVAGDVAVLAKRFWDLSNHAKLAFDKCVRLRATSRATSEEVRDAVEDYRIALLRCAPVPTWWYERYKIELNRLYDESHTRGLS
jgi:hypothetical protein